MTTAPSAESALQRLVAEEIADAVWNGDFDDPRQQGAEWELAGRILNVIKSTPNAVRCETCNDEGTACRMDGTPIGTCHCAQIDGSGVIS